MENRARGEGKSKEETTRQVLGDISNAEVKHITRPITRNYHSKLLANAPIAAKSSLDTTETIQKKRGVEECFDFNCKNNFREKLCRKIKSLTAEIAAQSKAACRILTEPEDQNLDIEGDDVNAEAAEYLDDIYKFYKLTEVVNPFQDYMNSQQEINEKMRSITVDWLIDVHWIFELMPETLYLTINILDRYLSLVDVPKAELQLVGISSMFIACKYEEIYPLKVKVFAKLSDGAYTKDQIVLMENAILEKLQWYLTVPTPYVFLIRFIRASEQPDHGDIVQMENIVFYFAELGLVHYQSVLYRPSVMAAAAVYAARCTLNRNPFWTEILKHKTGYSTEQIICCAKLLVSLQSRAADTKFNVVFRKFSSSDRGAVAHLPPPKHLLNSVE